MRPLELFALLAILAASSSCSVRIRPLGGYLLSSESLSAGSTSRQWPFSALTDASYTFAGDKIELSGGVCRLVAAEHSDTNGLAAGFGGGSANAVTYDGSSFLRLSQTGTPTNTAELDSSWAPQYSNLALYVKFNGTGQVADGAAVAATVGGALIADNDDGVGLAYGAGQLAEGITFSGSDDDLNLANNLSITNNASAFTVVGWIKPSASVSTMRDLFGMSRAACEVNSRIGILINSDANGVHAIRMLARSADADAGQQTQTPWMIATGEWTHFAAIVDYAAKTEEIYINGESVKFTAGLAFSANQTESTDSGCGSFASEDTGVEGINSRYEGSLDDFGVWRSVLTAEEVRTLYTRQAARYSGLFTSRVMDGLATGQAWTSIAWKTTLPFLKPLPDFASGAVQNESTTDYSALVGSTGAADDDDLMSGIVGLWHLNEPSGTTGVASVIDRSGSGNHGSTAGAPIFGSVGRIGDGVQFDGADDKFTVPDSPSLLPQNIKTVSFWMKKMGESNGGSHSYVVRKGEDYGVDTIAFQLWMGNPSKISLSVGRETAATAVAVDATGLVYQRWYHIVGVIRPTSIEIWKDGVREDTAAIAELPANDAGVLHVGGRGTDFFDGALDELAIWDRPLHESEIKQLYRRGSNRLAHQVRICSTADCSDDPAGANWKGPDGTKNTYFSEVFNRSVQAAVPTGEVSATSPLMTFANFASPPAAAQYFQYRTVLESDDAGTNCDYGAGATWCSPEMKRVDIAPVHYDSAAPTITGKIGASYRELGGFTATGATCPSGIGYSLGVGASPAAATWYWWDATKAADCVGAGTGAWCVADGTPAQSNSATDVGSFAFGLGSLLGPNTVYFRAFLRSDGTTACELDQLDLTGTFTN